jgi:hypothetical protein
MLRTSTISTILALTLGCGGSDTSQSRLNSFATSACKKEAATSSSTQQALLVADGSPAYSGLQCIAWERVNADRIRLDLVNFDGACGAQWQGQATVDQMLSLRIYNPGCRIASCGTCMYDWSFDVSGVKPAAEILLAITVDTCPGGTTQQTKTYELALPLEPDHGVLCRYASWGGLGWQAMATGTCGALGMPCQGTMMCGGSTATSTSGQSGLTCGSNGHATQLVCLQPCTGDADCPGSGVLACQSGLCRPAQTW